MAQLTDHLNQIFKDLTIEQRVDLAVPFYKVSRIIPFDSSPGQVNKDLTPDEIKKLKDSKTPILAALQEAIDTVKEINLKQGIPSVGPNSLIFLFTGKNVAGGAVLDVLGLSVIGLSLSMFLLPVIAVAGMVFVVLPLFTKAHVYARWSRNPSMKPLDLFHVFTHSYLLALPYILMAVIPFLDINAYAEALLVVVPGTFHLIADAFIMGRRDAEALGKLISMDPKNRLEALMGPIERTTDVFAPSIRTIERMAMAQRHPVLGFVYRVSFRHFAPAEAKSAIKRGLDLNQGNLVNALLQHRTVAPAAGVLPEATLIGMTISQEEMADLPALLESVSDNNRSARVKQYLVVAPGEGVSAKELSEFIGANNPLARIVEGNTPREFVNNIQISMGAMNLNPVTTSIVILSAPEFENAQDELQELLRTLDEATETDSVVRRRIIEAILKAIMAPIRMSVHELLMMNQASRLAQTSA
ncbi:MAG: hypothetical protein IPN19_00745 [Elusimicrobia bacterium]|nr:hypothetical protein [Elusimicrobiota bacterium]